MHLKQICGVFFYFIKKKIKSKKMLAKAIERKKGVFNLHMISHA